MGPSFRDNAFLFYLVSLSFFKIKLALFRNTIIETEVGRTKLLYFTILKKEPLKRILLSDFKTGWSIAMIARKHEFQTASHPYLD
jgi:hypothetical protein